MRRRIKEVAKVIEVVRSSMPVQKPGKSKQDYGTPTNFIRAVEARFGDLGVDLAATKENAKAKVWISPEEDSLRVNWQQWRDENCWLNPPFADIAPWAKRCAEMGATSIFGRLGPGFDLWRWR